MFLKRNRRGAYEYWTLVQSERTSRGPRQRVVAHLGKGPGLDEAERRGWKELDALLEGRRAAGQPELWDLPPLRPERSNPSWAQVDFRIAIVVTETSYEGSDHSDMAGAAATSNLNGSRSSPAGFTGGCPVAYSESQVDRS